MLFFWIFLYGLILTAVNAAASLWMRSILLAGYVLAFLSWIRKTGSAKQAGLMPMAWGCWEDVAYLLPLLLFPVYNLLFRSGPFPPGAIWLEMLSVCLVEELFFRGFLLSWFQRKGIPGSILFVSLAFSAMHLVNCVSTADGQYVFLQAVSSFFVSICYCAVTLRWGSVLPCVAAHFLTNIFGTGELTSIPALVCCVVLHALWDGVLCLKTIKEKKNAILH